MSLSRVLSSGLEVVVKTSGKQTLTQVFDEAGNLIKTRLKSIDKSIVPPVRQKKMGFAVDAGAELPEKKIFTITKNEFEHTSQKSAASVLDRVYIKGERVGERVISAEGNGDAMEAMKCIKHDVLHHTLNKVLRFFKDGKIVKENRYEFEFYKRRSRYNVDFDLEKEIETLKTKLDNIKFNDTEKIKNEISAIEAQRNNILEKMEPLDIKVQEARHELYKLQSRLEHQQKQQKKAQTINKLLTEEFKTEEEFQKIMEEIKYMPLKEDSYEERLLCTVYDDYLENGTNIHDRLKEKLKNAFSDKLEKDYNSVISRNNTDIKNAKQALKNAERAYNRKADKLKSELDKLSEKQNTLERNLSKSVKQNEKLEKKQHILISQIKEAEAKREPLTLHFNGSSLRADIDGIDFTL